MALNTEICRICLTIIQTKIDINDVYENTYHLIDLIHEVYSEEVFARSSPISLCQFN